MMQRYEKYKDSGVDWIGEIPEGWFQEPFSSVFSLKSVINNKNEELLSVYLDKGVIRFSDVGEKRTNVTSEDLSKYQLVEEGDFVLNNQQAWRGSVGVSFYRGIVSPAYIVLAIKNNFDFRFLNYLLRNRSFVTHYLLCSKGVGTIQRNLYWPQLKRVYLIFPSLEEQQTIATFLDDKTTKIDQTIANKQKEIELLKERRQILIQKAVTKGLDDTVPLKDSGVDWIGEIPEHWEVRKLKSLSKKIGDGLHGTPEYDDNGNYYFINGNNLMNDKIAISDITKTVNEKEYLKNKKFLTDNTLLLSINGTIGNVAYYSNEKIVLGKSACYINLKQHFNKYFIGLYFKSNSFKQYYELVVSGSTIYNLSLHSVANTKIPFPPSSEQKEILKLSKKIEEKTSKAILLKQQEIEKLKEYKTVLIDNVVTGKVRVS